MSKLDTWIMTREILTVFIICFFLALTWNASNFNLNPRRLSRTMNTVFLWLFLKDLSFFFFICRYVNWNAVLFSNNFEGIQDFHVLLSQFMHSLKQSLVLWFYFDFRLLCWPHICFIRYTWHYILIFCQSLVVLFTFVLLSGFASWFPILLHCMLELFAFLLVILFFVFDVGKLFWVRQKIFLHLFYCYFDLMSC